MTMCQVSGDNCPVSMVDNQTKSRNVRLVTLSKKKIHVRLSKMRIKNNRLTKAERGRE